MSATMETVLGIVRNPYGYTDDQVRAARLALADAYEREVAEVERLKRAAAVPAQPAELTGNPFVRAGRLREQREAAQPAEPQHESRHLAARRREESDPDYAQRMTAARAELAGAQPAESAVNDADYVLALIDETFANVPEIKRHHDRMRAIAARLAAPPNVSGGDSLGQPTEGNTAPPQAPAGGDEA